MNRIICIVSLLSLMACGKSHKLTIIGKPEKSVISTSVSEFSEISFLFVLDTSGSMRAIHSNMVKNFKYLFPVITEHPYYDYNFAVTTMSPYKGFNLPNQVPLFMPEKKQFDHCKFDSDSLIQKTSLGSYFHYNSSDSSEESFKNILCVLSESISSVSGYNDGGDEWYFSSLDFMLKYVDENITKSFFSKDNLLVIIFVSDAVGELVASTQFDSDSDSKNTILRLGSDYAVDKLEKIVRFKTNNNIKAYGVVPRTPLANEGSCGEATAADLVGFPVHVYTFIEETGGRYFPVCKNDNWGQDLTVVSDDLKSFLNTPKFLLDEVPLVETIKVFYNDYQLLNDVSGGWYYNPETVSVHIGKGFEYHKYDVKGKDGEYIIKYNPFNPAILYNRK